MKSPTDTTDNNEGDAQAAAVVSDPTPRDQAPRPRNGRRSKGTITRNVGIPKEQATTKAAPKTRAKRTATAKPTAKRPYTRRTPVATGVQDGNHRVLLAQMLTANGFTLDSAKLVVTEGRKTMTLPLGLFTGK